MEYNSFECISTVIAMQTEPLLVTSLYRPPNNSPSMILDDFHDFLEDTIAFTGITGIIGDFNLHIDDCSRWCVIRFLDILSYFILTQHVHTPTHVSGHRLDLIITRSDKLCPVISPSTDALLSDHLVVLCLRPPSMQKETYRSTENSGYWHTIIQKGYK